MHVVSGNVWSNDISDVKQVTSNKWRQKKRLANNRCDLGKLVSNCKNSKHSNFSKKKSKKTKKNNRVDSYLENVTNMTWDSDVKAVHTTRDSPITGLFNHNTWLLYRHSCNKSKTQTTWDQLNQNVMWFQLFASAPHQTNLYFLKCKIQNVLMCLSTAVICHANWLDNNCYQLMN